MIQTIKEMGLLRNLLHGAALLFAIMLPFAQGPQYSEDWDLFFSGILPATAPILVIIIGLDLMMSNIWKSDASPERIQHFNSIIKAHLLVGGILLASWLVIFLPVLV